MIFYSVVVPVLNEEKNVKSLHKEILEVMRKLKKQFEIIFVNDGSTDNTLEELKKLSPIKIINLRKNSGQSAALDAGIKNAKGKIIITLDGDGQNDPKDIPRLLKKLQEGYDVVCGWRYRRKDPFSKRLISQGAKLLRKFLVNDGIHDSGCTLRVYKRECFRNLDLYGEMHRMIPALLRWQGFSITEIKVNHRPRKHGRTKYNWKRTIKGFLDMIDTWFWRKYQSRPLHLFGTLGLILILFSSSLLFYLALKRLFYHYPLSNKIWPLVGAMGLLAGIQFLVFGLLANLILRNSQSKEFYSIKNIIEKK
ncbi:glycosyltransferase family 2 protein [bacterium]|nr:glycosyltransferase family 2 protein [bacterium]